MEYFQESLTEFSEVLFQISSAVESFESNSHGYVDENYLENDVIDGLDTVEETTVQLTGEANSIIESVQDLVSINKIDESEVMESVRRGKTKTNENIEELHALDNAQVEALSPVWERLNTMKQFVFDLESMFTKGDLSVDIYDPSVIQLNGAYIEMMSSTDPLKAIELKIENAVSYIAPYLAMLYPQILLPLTYKHHEISQIPLNFTSIERKAVPGLEYLTNEELKLIDQSEIHIDPDDSEEDIKLKEYFIKLQNGEVDGEYSISNYDYPDTSDYGEITVWHKMEIMGGLNRTGGGFGTKESEKALIKGIADFLILDDINTLTDKDEGWVNKTIAAVSLFPAGKILKIAKGKKLFSTAKKKPKHNLTKAQLATKPKHSPNPDKWIDKGGKIDVDNQGTWTYTNKKGQSVSYPNGFPDFTEYMHPTVKPVKIKVNNPENRPADNRLANQSAGLDKNSNPPVPSLDRPPKGYTWHHHEDGTTMILVERSVHTQFTHRGGISTNINP